MQDASALSNDYYQAWTTYEKPAGWLMQDALFFFLIIVIKYGPHRRKPQLDEALAETRLTIYTGGNKGKSHTGRRPSTVKGRAC